MLNDTQKLKIILKIVNKHTKKMICDSHFDLLTIYQKQRIKLIWKLLNSETYMGVGLP